MFADEARNEPKINALRYLLPSTLVVVALFTQLLLREKIGEKAFLLLYPALFFGSLVGGFWPCLIATTLASLGAWYFFIPYASSFEIKDGADIFGLVVFSVTGILAGVLSERLRMTRRNLQAAVEARDEFLSIASHELKTPLTALSLQLELAKRSLKPEQNLFPSPEKLTKVFRVSTVQIGRISSLVEELLDVSKIRAGKLPLRFEMLDLKQLLEEVVERFQEQFKEGGFSINTYLKEALPTIGDRFRLEQVITNLLSNGIKYGEGRSLRLTGILSEDKQNIVISLQDFGIGIPKEKQQKIFERFERAISSKNISGLGLGLYISKQIVEAHHGTIRVESEPGNGSTFTVILPSSESTIMTDAEKTSGIRWLELPRS